MKKADILLILGCLFAALLLGLFFVVYRKDGRVAYVTCGGDMLEQIDLSQEGAGGQTLYYLIRYTEGAGVQIIHSEVYPELPREQSYNLFSVIDGTVTMEAADCRDQICVNHKPISNRGESVICLPHRLIIEISGGEDIGVIESLDGQNGERSGSTSGEPAEGMLDGVVR